ncbi:lysoplasmalogenase [Flavobacterium frigoris]|uniref:YhhN family protein n=1 Tax=Flavobacterium frigoris (strain PS1) TaxID=1086011 RepID=H7FTH1_FLAFP|nr:lysoplasmalogenase [Flavobacterium frigoris]EIA08375.1 YhhN family protein [Flavobacterium frigoris PS1]
MKNELLLKSYLGISLFYLLIILLGQEEIAWFLKPFLIPFLLLAVFFSGSFPSKKFLLTALTFSWIGDIILLFADRDELFFIVGLIAFLISHIVYILLFNKQLKYKNRKNKAVFWIGVTVIIVYLFVMISILLPTLGDLTLPVFVYALVISTMLLFALKGFLNWEKSGSWYILIGAIAFVSSDSILAFNKFYSSIVMSSFLIMVTYLIAQYLIVVGILKLNQKK